MLDILKYVTIPGIPVEDLDDVGTLAVFVTLNHRPGTKDGVFEFEVLDYSGCVDSINESVGFDYWLTDMTGLHHEMKAGRTYIITGIVEHYTPAVTWRESPVPQDADIEWEYDSIEERLEFISWALQTISNAWWLSLGHRIRNMRNRYAGRLKR